MAAVYQLLGYPGTGKYTVAREIVRLLQERGEHAALLDNHATAHLIWSLVPAGKRFDPEVMGKLMELRIVLLDAVEQLASADTSLVFTNFLPPGQPVTIIDRHRELAVRHDRKLVAVVLSCDPGEVLQRIPAADRAARSKLVDVARARVVLAGGMTMPAWPELGELDTSGLSAEDAARRIIALADA